MKNVDFNQRGTVRSSGFVVLGAGACCLMPEIEVVVAENKRSKRRYGCFSAMPDWLLECLVLSSWCVVLSPESAVGLQITDSGTRTAK